MFCRCVIPRLLRLLHSIHTIYTQAEETQNKSAVELTLNVLAAEVATQESEAEETQNSLSVNMK